MSIDPSIPRFGLNRTEVALSIGVSPNTIDAMVESGSLPPPRKWNKRKFWLAREIEAAMLDWPIDGAQEADAGDWVAST
jgi:predicted DNA-binding transcriptional regulator AlpA